MNNNAAPQLLDVFSIIHFSYLSLIIINASRFIFDSFENLLLHLISFLAGAGILTVNDSSVCSY